MPCSSTRSTARRCPIWVTTNISTAWRLPRQAVGGVGARLPAGRDRRLAGPEADDPRPRDGCDQVGDDVASVDGSQAATRLYPGTDRPAVDQPRPRDRRRRAARARRARRARASRRRCACSPASSRSTTGAIYIGDRDVSDVRPRDRDIAMVFQNYALYPQLTVAENMGFALKQKGVPKAERIAQVREAARILDLEPYLDRKPKNLSGGQRQRVAMGRAIVRHPQVYLMDEPLSNLDAKLRVQTRAELAELQARLGGDDRVRHPRPGRGDDDGPPRRRAPRRGAAAVRHAARPLPRARTTCSWPASSARRR